MAIIGAVKARLLAQVGNDPVELGTFEIPLSTGSLHGKGIGTIHVDETTMCESLASALEDAAKNLRANESTVRP